MSRQLDSGCELWQHKEGEDVVRVRFLRHYVLFQLVKTPASDAMFYVVLLRTATDRIEFGWYRISKSNFYNYFEPVPKLKKILLKEMFGI